MLLTPTTAMLILVALIAFSMGMTTSWILIKEISRPKDSTVRIWLAVIVTLVWVAAVVADILITGYSISPLIHAIMGAIVGYFFTQEGLDLTKRE